MGDRLADKYPSLLHASLDSARAVNAIVTSEGSLTYGELDVETRRMMAGWHFDTTRPVMLHAQSTLRGFIALHALNRLGINVVLSRCAVSELTPEWVSEQGFDQWVCPHTWESMCADNDGQMAVASLELDWRWRWEDTQFLIASSGTTGIPKWIPITTRQLTLSAFGSATRLGHLPGDVWLNVLAPGYTGWLAAIGRCAFYGTTVINEPFSVELVNQYLSQSNVTQISLVPTMLSKLVNHKPSHLNTVRSILVGGGPLRSELYRQSRSLGLNVLPSWGLTEAGSQVATQTFHATSDGFDVGYPMPFVKVDVTDEHLSLDGPLVNAPLVTHDRGRIDDEGRVFVHGRSDDVINTGGIKVDPKRIEGIYGGLDGARCVTALAMPDNEWGQQISLAIEVDFTKLEACLDSLHLIRSKAAKHHRFQTLYWIDRTPRCPMGKVQRRLLRLAFLELNQLMRPQTANEELGQSAGLECGQVDRGVSQANNSVEFPPRPFDAMLEGQTAFAQQDDSNFDLQILPLTNGRMEVTFSIHEGQTYRFCVKQLIPVPEDRKEKLFERNMSVFEDATKKYDASSVDFVKSGLETVTKGHGVNLPNRKGKSKI